MLAELHGKTIAPEILDELYIELGERGWTIQKVLKMSQKLQIQLL